MTDHCQVQEAVLVVDLADLDLELHRHGLREACFPRSAHLPGLTGSERVRGSNPLSSTLATPTAFGEFPQVALSAGRPLLIS